MYGTWIGIGSAAVMGVTIGFGLGSALGQQTPKGVEPQELGRVDAGENCPGHVLRMRRVTFAPGASIPQGPPRSVPRYGGHAYKYGQGSIPNAVSGRDSRNEWSGGRA